MYFFSEVLISEGPDDDEAPETTEVSLFLFLLFIQSLPCSSVLALSLSLYAEAKVLPLKANALEVTVRQSTSDIYSHPFLFQESSFPALQALQKANALEVTVRQSCIKELLIVTCAHVLFSFMEAPF